MTSSSRSQINHLASLTNSLKIQEEGQIGGIEYQSSPEIVRYPMRAVFIALDMTKTIQMKDFKPSRLSVCTQMIKHFIKKAQEETPVIKFCFSIVEDQLCKLKTFFTCDIESIFEQIDNLKPDNNNGFFSLENTLQSALEQFEGVSNCFQKYPDSQTASSLTKDYKDVYQTITHFKNAKIHINIISLVGWTHVFQKLVSMTNGKYVTVSTSAEFKNFAEEISHPLRIPEDQSESSIQTTIFKATLCKKQVVDSSKVAVTCHCHFQQTDSYYVCGFCCAITCKEPPIECSVCRKLILLPTDLSRHKLID